MTVPVSVAHPYRIIMYGIDRVLMPLALHGVVLIRIVIRLHWSHTLALPSPTFVPYCAVRSPTPANTFLVRVYEGARFQ